MVPGLFTLGLGIGVLVEGEPGAQVDVEYSLPVNASSLLLKVLNADGWKLI